MNWGAIATSVPDGQGPPNRPAPVSSGGVHLLRRPFQLELVVLGQDLLVRRTVVRHARMMVFAEDVRRPIELMVPDSPTPLRVAVHLPHARVNTHAHGADQRGLAEVGAEAGPEVVVEVWPAVQGPGVECEPVA